MPSPCDYGSSSESEDINRTLARSRQIRSLSDSRPQFLAVLSRRSSVSSSSFSCDSPQLYPKQSSSCLSDSDSEHRTPLLFDFEDRRSWSSTRRRRKKGWRITRWMRWLVRRRFFPNQPTTIVRCLITYQQAY
jgi:hypothetical protein